MGTCSTVLIQPKPKTGLEATWHRMRMIGISSFNSAKAEEGFISEALYLAAQQAVLFQSSRSRITVLRTAYQ
jgi:hypothetical protein